MTNKVKVFLEKVSSDEILKAQLTAALKDLEKTEQIQAVIAFAAKQGCELTEEDFVTDGQNIDQNELETVNGGGGCACVFGGGGGGDGLDCFCVAGGSGGFGNYFDVTSQGGCSCFAAGAGATNIH